MFLAVLLSAFVALVTTHHIRSSASQLLIFPMAVVPNLWGLWNVAYVAISRRSSLNRGFFGAVLPFVIAPLGYVKAKLTGHLPRHGGGALFVAFVVLVLFYYLIWKHIVGFLNESLDLE